MGAGAVVYLTLLSGYGGWDDDGPLAVCEVDIKEFGLKANVWIDR